jgi:hypothetical protein
LLVREIKLSDETRQELRAKQQVMVLPCLLGKCSSFKRTIGGEDL